MSEQQIRDDTQTAGSAMNGNVGGATMTTKTDSSRTRDAVRERTTNMAQVAGAAALEAAGTLRNRASEIPGGDRSTQAAKAVADRVERVANRAMGRRQPSFFERLASAITDNKIKVAIGAALLAAAGAFATQKALTGAVASDQLELADEA